MYFVGVCYADFVGCDFELDLCSLVGFVCGFVCCSDVLLLGDLVGLYLLLLT